MDGGCVHCQRDVPQFCIRLVPSKSINLFNINDPRSVRIPWYFGAKAFGTLRTGALGVPWIVLRQEFADKSESAVGMPVPTWRRIAWEGGLVEIDRFVDGEWVEITEKDWRVLNAKEA